MNKMTIVRPKKKSSILSDGEIQAFKIKSVSENAYKDTVRLLDLLDLNLTNLTTLTYLTTLTTLTKKEQLLIQFIEPCILSKAINNINISLKNGSAYIEYKTRGTGLLPEGYIEIVEENPTKYKITKKGEDLLLNFVIEHNNKIEYEKKLMDEQRIITEDIKAFKQLIQTYYKKHILNQLSKNKKWISLDYMKLAEYDYKLANGILDEPEEYMKKLELAIESLTDEKGVIVRFYNLPKTQKLKVGEIRIKNLKKFYSFEGIIKQRSEVRPHTTMIKYECPNCGNILSVLQLDDKINEPNKCGCGRKGKFRVINKDYIDVQVLKLEEMPEQLDGKTNASLVNIVLKDVLAKEKFQKFYNPGSIIKLNGIVNSKELYFKNSKSTKSDLLIEANYIELDTEEFNLTLTDKDKEQIRDISKKDNYKKLLIDSFAPDVLNLDDEKLGLILSLVDGFNCKRNKIHILYAGDPGLAKSDLLKNIDRLFYFCRYASGSSSSSVGLTASVVKDDFTGGFSLNAGAVVMSNNGCCGVDELDKMPLENQNDLNEAMEQGTVTINKAQIHGSLKANTAIIAACNPKTHKFNNFDDYITQINLPLALITRFDLIFVMKNLGYNMKKLFDNILFHSDNIETLDEKLFIKYILYARTFEPKLKDNVKKFISEKLNYLLEFNGIIDSKLPFSICPRQLSGFIRLSSAFAKLRLSNLITLKDAEDAWNIYLETLVRMGFNE